MRACALVAMALLAVPAARAGEEGTRLRDAPGRDLVSARCAICHSLDYITMNAPLMTAPLWEKSVAKMVKVMGAPVAEDEVREILAYLDGNYVIGSQP